MSKYSYERILETVPVHLQSFVVDQNYDRYTAQDQAVWRYIMRKNINFLGRHAHPSYLLGLKKTGISVDKIPDVEIMNEALDTIGWRAVVVDGFIPPAAFMEFQAHKILVISAEMRTIKHILYTPAPDIVHEAAGHAPIISDTTYAEYLQKFGEVGSKAMSSKMDFEVYEAIRHLSIIKEFPGTSGEEIKKAETDLNRKIEANKIPSEAALLSRLHWWTVEYGLIGTPSNYKQFGAGLLSSVGESQHCLNPKVKKIPLSIRCINYNYDITTMQPQLFVAENWQHLIDVLNDFASRMCFQNGGMESIKKAIESENVSTIEYSSGLQVSGILSEVKSGDNGEPVYINLTGPSALAYKNKEIPEHGTIFHKDGFGSPVGKLSGIEKVFESFTEEELEKNNIVKGKRTKLKFNSGIIVEGNIENIIRYEDMIQAISFKNCQVTDKTGNLLFQPESGMYHMAVGENIRSVFAGSADKEKFNVFPPKSKEIAIKIDHPNETKHLFALYQLVQDVKNKISSNDLTKLDDIEQEVSLNYPEEWLIYLEIAEIIKDVSAKSNLLKICLKKLEELKGKSEEYRNLITDGLKLI